MKKQSLKPLIKYTGGKYNEYNQIKDYFPKTINNYYEPFFGGGGVFFQLHNISAIKGKSYINDISVSLMDLYRSIPDINFHKSLWDIYNGWKFIKEFADSFYQSYGERFEKLMTNDKESVFITDDIKKFIHNKLKSIPIDQHNFSIEKIVIKSLNDKISRFRKKDIKEEDNLSYKCISTCICQSFYFLIRNMYNDWNNHGHSSQYTNGERIAQWVFIREFSFGSMFRFGKNGDFNVPYGGFGYNTKDFKSKIENIICEETQRIFTNTDISCDDFENVINNWKYEEDDFMFLDPPYDSTFSDYDNNIFSQLDHKRLYDCLSKCKCKWMMAISKTDFIVDLYKDYEKIEYDKTYMYQARGTYDTKHTKHILIKNF